MILRNLNDKMFTKMEDHTLENLYSFFGNNLLLAMELLDKCKLIQYTLQQDTRKEHCTIYDNINFCHCAMFRVDVLEKGQSLACKHVLAVKLGKIMNMVTKEVITGAQMVEFLNEQFISLTEV
nr:unnamed protein product [Callosobruchus analis]